MYFFCAILEYCANILQIYFIGFFCKLYLKYGIFCYSTYRLCFMN